MNKASSTDMKWIETPEQLKIDVPFVKGLPLRPIDDNKILYQVYLPQNSGAKDTAGSKVKIQVNNNRTYLMSKCCEYDDMCNMDILNQPEVLNNLIQRYKNDKIFTFIGPTLIVVNPYRVLPQYFGPKTLTNIRQKMLQNSQISQPHIYLIAGNAFNAMVDQQKKQAIVISGESGAGKTQSTKYCMQFLTSLTINDSKHNGKQSHPIQGKILACNPILQAFGNSKTLRNDNSSRFGKYVQIYFSGDHSIIGASINSYLLEKSRVVSASQGERNFHIFYSLIGSKILPLNSPQSYKYLEKSKCYDIPNLNEKESFKQIQSSMTDIGFNQKQQMKIWQLLGCILELGNIQFDDQAHQQQQSKPCSIKGITQANMNKMATLLGVDQKFLQKILLFQKKSFLKQITFTPYNKNKCIANTNTLNKAIYNAIFEFILFKIQISLRPVNCHHSAHLSINILDIFGFQNFPINSFQQFCINFTNEKLLKLYNQYIFQRQMKILKEDGLDAEIKAPTNQTIIQAISGKVSLFSIIIDYTMPTQFKDADMVAGFQNKLTKSGCIEFDKISKNKFTILHSQCNVKYDIEGFKQKNQDKVLPEIADIVNNLFQHQSRDQAGKTLLTKFSKQIDDLMQQLNSSSVHFIRCIKPNQKKVPKLVQQKYMLTQVRYLGVFQTIQIRKKTFPSRWIYSQFIQRFEALFPSLRGDQRTKAQKILAQLTKDPKDYLLGNKRVYMNSQLQSKLLKKLHEAMKRKIQSGKKIWRAYNHYRMKQVIKIKLKLLSKRIGIWRKLAKKYQIENIKKKFNKIKQYYMEKLQQQELAKNKKLMQQKKARQKLQQKQRQQKIQKRKSILPKLSQLLQKIIKSNTNSCFLAIKQAKPKAKVEGKPVDNIQKSSTFDPNQTVFVQQYSSTSPQNYERTAQNQNQNKNPKQQNFQMNQKFLDQKSVLIQQNASIAFAGTMKVPLYRQEQAKNLKKLYLILSDNYKPQFIKAKQSDFIKMKDKNGKTEDILSPLSEDNNFQIQDTQHQLLNKIVSFDSKQFFKKVLRKRTNFFGMTKDQDDILVVKNRPLNHSLTQLSGPQQQQSLLIFKQILKISQQSKLDSVFKQIEYFILTCLSGTPRVTNQVLLQLVKQSNNSSQVNSIRVLQAFIVFVHVYQPDKDFLLAVLNFIFKRLAQNCYSDKQTQYFKYLFKKICYKFTRTIEIHFLPVKYQIMALMCKRVISIPIYLSIGSSSHIKVQSHESLADIKERVMTQMGINSKRLPPKLFSFVQLSNYGDASQERPLNQKLSAWDLVSYWQKSNEKYQDKEYNSVRSSNGETEFLHQNPSFYLILKIKYLFQCHEDDEQVIQLMFGQCFFDYFMGRVRLTISDMAILAAIIIRVKKMDISNTQSYKNSYPSWIIYNPQLVSQLTNTLTQTLQSIPPPSSYQSQVSLKYRFIKLSQKSPLAMSITVPVLNQPTLKLHFRHKYMYLSDDGIVQETIPIKSILKYTRDENYFVFGIRNQNKIRMYETESVDVCTDYMTGLQELMTQGIGSYGHGYSSVSQYGSQYGSQHPAYININMPKNAAILKKQFQQSNYQSNHGNSILNYESKKGN